MNKREIVQKHITKEGMGLEIGPSFDPIAPKKAGYRVHTIDHMNQAQLIEKYTGHNVNLENIEEVDFVWKGESYTELTGKHKYYDWVIASHLIEHTPDLIGFLKECDSVMKDNGMISLVVPDKRFCFDHYRSISSISKIIDNHFQKRTSHTAGDIIEYYLNRVKKGGCIAWHSRHEGQYNLAYTYRDAITQAKQAVEKKQYMDIHSWCFTPHSFRLIIHDLFNLGLIPFQEVDFVPTIGHEFFVTLGRNGNGISSSRLDLLEAVKQEIATDTLS